MSPAFDGLFFSASIFLERTFYWILVVWVRCVCSSGGISAQGGTAWITTNIYFQTDSSSRLSKNTGTIKSAGTTRHFELFAPLARGAEGIRTLDPLVANQVLSQLSYSPVACGVLNSRLPVGLGRVERPTSRLSGVRSNHLSYRPVIPLGFTDGKERTIIRK